MKKPRSDSKLKNLSEEIQADLWARLNTGGETYTDAREWLLAEHKLKTSEAALSGWYSWYAVRLEIRSAQSTADQMMEELALLNPDISPERVMDFGQMIFSMKAVRQSDAKTFAAFANIAERREARKQEAEKFKLASKSKIDAGLDALFSEIKGNKKAETIFEQLKKAVAEA